MPIGTTIKAQCVRQPFWRHDGLGSQVTERWTGEDHSTLASRRRAGRPSWPSSVAKRQVRARVGDEATGSGDRALSRYFSPRAARRYVEKVWLDDP
jgi:hypothetical protein